MNAVLEQARKMLDGKGVKYAVDQNTGRVAAKFNTGEYSYIVEITHVRETYFKIFARMPFVVEKDRLPRIAVYICELNKKLIYANYKLNLETGIVTLEYNFLSKDNERLISVDTLWTYYYSVHHIVGGDIAKLRDIACGTVPAAEDEAYRKLFKNQHPKSEDVHPAPAMAPRKSANADVLRYFAKG